MYQTNGIIETGRTLVIPTRKVVGPKLWTPAKLTALGWYDASDLSTITSVAGAVSQWDDKSGNSQHLTQGTGSRQPSTGTRVLNGRNVIDFDGVDDRMTKSGFAIPSSGDAAFFCVAVVDVVNSTFDPIFGVNATNDFQLESNNASSFAGRIASAGIGSSSNLSGGPFPGPSVYSCTFDFTGSATYYAHVDGTKRTGDTSYTAKLSTSQILNMMVSRNGASLLDGAIAEFVVIESCDSTCRQFMEGYLAWKWGQVSKLPSAHPYKSKPPYWLE